jgi:preprotein translocase subunit SecG
MPYVVLILGNILPYIQIALAVLLMVAILLQQSEASLGAAFGGDSSTSSNITRRGFEKTLFQASIVLAVLFVASALLAILL